ncbi:MAG TPA: TetR family transcriptional regulator [Pseudonocardiaceae bacterium]|nr:TetR family transcriptional regulator [Pseudonocardiaceae bacterium]
MAGPAQDKDNPEQTEEGGGPARRRGRRPAGADTRAALLAAAREVFAEQGYAGATVRAIAGRAGVDAAMVNHWFGGKQGLFSAVMEMPKALDLAELVSGIVYNGDREPARLAERIVRTFVTLWDANEGQFAALIRSVSSQDITARVFRDFLTKEVLHRVADQVGADQSDLRASLCASQMVGVGMARYVVKLGPLADASVDTIVRAVAPTLTRYLTEDILG